MPRSNRVLSASWPSRRPASDRPKPPLSRGFGGSGGGTRTHNLRINSPALCQLSYPGRAFNREGAPNGAER